MANQPELKVWHIGTGSIDLVKLDIDKTMSKKEDLIIKAKTFLSSAIKGDILTEIEHPDWLVNYQKGIQIFFLVEGSGVFSIANISPIAKFIYLKSIKPIDKIEYDFSKAFIIMSMTKGNKDLDDIRDSIVSSVKEASSELHIPNIECYRIDDNKGSTYKIDEKILKSIESSGIIICDLTEEKPNCYYELAWAFSYNRKVIITAKQGTTIHFDVKNWNIRFWENQRELKSYIKDDIKSIINESLLK